MNNIPFFDIKRQYDAIAEEVEAAVVDVMRSTSYIGGKTVQKLEESIAEYIGVDFAISCGNGTDALYIALKANGVGIGDEVITTPFTFFATAEAISQTGAIPVFADIKEDTLNIDPESVKEKITEKTKAILPVHIFGLPADMDEINAIAGEYGIPVIEDACQAIGSEYKGKMAGNLGQAGCFSFYPTKNLGAFGDGGLITTNSEEIATCCKAIKAHAAGKTGADAYQIMYHDRPDALKEMSASKDGLYDPYKYYNYFIGQNSRLDAIQAAVLLTKLPHLNEYNGRRHSIAEKYNEALSDLPVVLPQVDRLDRVSCFHQYALLTEKKDELVSYLANEGIGTGAFYPVPLHLQKAYKHLGYKDGSLPVSESVCRRSVCLPVFPELTESEVDYIIDKIRGFYI
ncbi:MAG: DegT/DnrJ/EryC1/StrS family aminotransferase [Lachnospiraceae bacterium]|nr:DegT/DnrJ/EryC1/StrS family aminotransferase [Lachnospiraceae bacterium]